MGGANWANQTIWTGDNLPILRGMNSGSVDLIYLDPPFNSKANYAAPIGSEAAGAEFKDTWTLSDVDVAWLDLLEAKHPALNRVIHAALNTSDKSYLIYMAVRLLELRRVLKDTGSIYLHCDPTMSHYLKLVMDAIFGRGNFRNEIVWAYRGREMHITTKFNAKHDLILFYSASPGVRIRMDAVAIPYDRAEKIKSLRRKVHRDEAGREWVWETRGQAKGQKPYKRYVDEIVQKGRALSDVWTEFQFLRGNHPERTGYPTQKPLALLRRVIEASSEGGGGGGGGWFLTRFADARRLALRRSNYSANGRASTSRRRLLNWFASGWRRNSACSTKASIAPTYRSAPTWNRCAATTIRPTSGRSTGNRTGTATDAGNTSARRT